MARKPRRNIALASLRLSGENHLIRILLCVFARDLRVSSLAQGTGLTLDSGAGAGRMGCKANHYTLIFGPRDGYACFQWPEDLSRGGRSAQRDAPGSSDRRIGNTG